MVADALLSRVLDDDTLTSGLNDPEARLLIEWLVDRAEEISRATSTPADSRKRVETLCLRARGIRQFVALWCHHGDRRAAMQLAATERFGWPLPHGRIDPCELLHDILTWEQAHLSGQHPVGRASVPAKLGGGPPD